MELDKLIDQFKNQTMQETGNYIEPEDNVLMHQYQDNL